MHKRLDIKAESWADARDVFLIQFLQDGRLACITEPSIRYKYCESEEQREV